jgi:PA14 domain/Cytochrome C oxidase, cbb3-type, subunit III
MILKTITPILLTGLLCSPLFAQDGGQLYGLYCSACHGVDGKGATGGALPPLAGSEWVTGNPKRTISIALLGLHGPIEVAGKAYNLEMPPQGSVLANDQLSAIINYVHSSWGNTGEKVTPELVASVRTELKDKTNHWTAAELQKLYPLDITKTALSNLISRVYPGSWNMATDFTKLESKNVEEEHNGLLDLTVTELKDKFAIVWDGQFEAPEDGTFIFELDADDCARLSIDGKNIAEIAKPGPMNGTRLKNAKVTLHKGAHPFRLEYIEYANDEGLTLRWKKARTAKWNNLTKLTKPEVPSIPIEPKNGITAVYRNFIKGTTPRAIGFGFPGGLNLAYSADNLAPEMLWTGSFMDGSLHWVARGMGNQPPAGDNIITLSKERFLPAEARFKGYNRDALGNPTFIVSIGNQILKDSWKTGENDTLIRTLILTGGTATLDIPTGAAAPIVTQDKVSLSPDKPVSVVYILTE